MSEPRPDPQIPDTDSSPTAAEEPAPAIPAPGDVADDLDVLDAEGERVRRSDPLAAGVAVLVLAALLGCAALVLIAAGNG